jgi:hypothetical protein
MRSGRLTLAAICLLAIPLGTPGAPYEPPVPAEYVQAVEFPYYLYPRAQWERELVWMRTIGVRTVEFSIPWNWHQLQPGEFDFTGRTSPRRDLVGLIHVLRKLGLRAWVRPLPPVEGWLNDGAPATADAGARAAWIKQLGSLLATQTASHGGPVAYVEGATLAIDAAPAPAAASISATDPAALALSRQAIVAGRAILWTGVEDAVWPAGWEPDAGPLLRTGVVGLAGDERPAVGALRRDGALLRNWTALLGALRPVPMPRQAPRKLPAGVTVAELASAPASAVSLTNRGRRDFHDDLRVLDPASRRTLVIPGVTVPAGDSLWLPLDVSLAQGALCRECSTFSPAEKIVYATAELLSVEFENGILAMEFAAPQAGAVVLQLARRPIGPFLAGGKPTEFDWDAATQRARLPIPAGTAADRRVRIGIAIAAPETSAFFDEAHRLVIGQNNLLSTTYSSPDLAERSRLRLPEGFSATPNRKSPNEIEYQVGVPADALHGDWANLALEADGVPLGRARVQLFRPASIRLFEAIQLHFGAQAELAVDPPTAPIEPRAGTDLEIGIRNNSPSIETYTLAASGDGLEFFPPSTEISVGATAERRVSLRIFARPDAADVEGLREWHLRVSGATTLDIPMRAVLVPRGRTVAWSADLDGDGSPEWILESQKARAVFSTQDGGRWIEFTSKDAGANFLPETGAFAALGPVQVQARGDALEFSGRGWRRTVRLAESTLSIEQDTPLPADGLAPEKRGNIGLEIAHPSASRATYTLSAEEPKPAAP